MTPGAIDQALTAPPAALGKRLLDLSENQWFDRKSFRIEPRKLAESLVGFANADGGTIAIGLSRGEVEGVGSNDRHLNSLMQAAVDFTEPTVVTNARLYECIREDGQPDHLLIIEVPPGSSVHTTSRDDAFLRIGDENHKLSFTQRRELFYDKSQSTFEAERTEASLDDVDRSLLDSYANVLEATEPERLLVARGLAADDRLTVAGLLLFGRHPERMLPSAQVRVCRFQGTHRGSGSRQNLIGDARIEGPIPHLLQEARDQVRKWQPTRRALGASGRFEDIGLVPEDAWLEGIVNAVVHRSYSVQGDHIHVDIYDDRIVIESPGRFPGLVDTSNPLEITRFARNPRIARVCTDLRITQELGEGIRRIFDEMRQAGLSDPLYHQTSGSVQLTLSGEPVERRITEQLPALQQRILTALREVDSMSTGEIADAVSVARPTALRHLGELRNAGYIEWVGKSTRDPRASWRIPH